MTVRVLVDDAPDAETGLAVAMRCTMDIYVRMPHDVVLAVPDPARAGEGPLGALVGKEAAERVAEAPQAFAGHQIRVIAHDDIREASLEDTIVILREATPELVDRVETQKVAGLIVVPQDATAHVDWVQRTNADVVRARA